MLRRRLVELLAVLACSSALSGVSGTAEATYVRPLETVTLATLPAVPGFAFDYHGTRFVTGVDGTVQIPRARHGQNNHVTVRTTTLQLGRGVRAEFDRWYALERLQQHNGRTTAALRVYYPVELRFQNLERQVVSRSSLGAVTLKSSTGFTVDLPTDTGRTTLQGSRVVPDNNGLQVKQLYFTVQDVDVQGNNVVNRSQTKFFPATDHVVSVPLLFFDATVRARDAFFGFGLSGKLHLTYPNGRGTVLPLGDNGRVDLPGLARGQYHLAVEGPGLRLSQPVAMSRRQDVDLKVFTWLDLAVSVVLLAIVAVGLLWWGRATHRRRLRARPARASLPKQRPQPVPVPVAARAPAPPLAHPLPWTVGPFVITAPDRPELREAGERR